MVIQEGVKKVLLEIPVGIPKISVNLLTESLLVLDVKLAWAVIAVVLIRAIVLAEALTLFIVACVGTWENRNVVVTTHVKEVLPLVKDMGMVGNEGFPDNRSTDLYSKVSSWDVT